MLNFSYELLVMNCELFGYGHKKGSASFLTDPPKKGAAPTLPVLAQYHRRFRA